MRSRLMLCLVTIGILLTAVPLFAQTPIPVFPGSKAEFELNLTQKDFLPVLRQWIGIIPGAAGAFIGASGAAQGNQEAAQMAAVAEQVGKEVQAVLADVNQVSVLAYQQPKNVSTDKIMDFYVQKMGLSKSWTRTLLVNMSEGSVEFYVRPDLQGMFGVAVGRGYVAAAKIDGKIDLVHLARIFAKYAPMFASQMDINIGGGGGNVESPQATVAGYQVILCAVGPQKVRVLGVIREVTGMSPSAAREYIQSLPQPLAQGLSQEDADALASRLKEMGATVEVKKVE